MPEMIAYGSTKGALDTFTLNLAQQLGPRGITANSVHPGIVDTDTYAAEIHFPFFATAEDGIYTLEKGAPLVQVIPFRRENMAIEADIRAERPTEGETRKQVFRNTLTGDGWYRKYARAGR